MAALFFGIVLAIQIMQMVSQWYQINVIFWLVVLYSTVKIE